MRTAVRILIIILILILAAGAAFTALYIYRSSLFPQETRKSGERDIAERFPFDSPDELKLWDEKLLARNRTGYKFEKEAGNGYVLAESDDSASTLYYKLTLFSAKRPYLSWRWKALSFPDRKKPESLDKKEEFDFVAQVYVIFNSRFFLSTKAIQYVWTETIPAGTVEKSPYTKNVRLLVLESGDPGEWKTEMRDIGEDFRTLFGRELDKDIVAVSFMTDADSTASMARACFDDIEAGYIPVPASQPQEGTGGRKPVLPGWLCKVPYVDRLLKRESDTQTGGNSH